MWNMPPSPPAPDQAPSPASALMEGGLRLGVPLSPHTVARLVLYLQELVRWNANGRGEWIDAANAERPAPSASGLMMPANGPVTSYFGYRYHPILHFTRFHAGLDIGAAWGSPIVAAGDGEVVGAGWSGGYGRQVKIAHSGGLMSSYGHMSSIAVSPNTSIRTSRVVWD